MAGLVPAISLMRAGQSLPKRDARDKPAHDAGEWGNVIGTNTSARSAGCAVRQWASGAVPLARAPHQEPSRIPGPSATTADVAVARAGPRSGRWDETAAGRG